MITAGQILKENREKQKITLDKVSQETKIRKEFLIALEEDNYQFFPSEITIKGFLRNYALFLGIDHEKILSVFKRDYKKKEEQKLILEEENFRKKFEWNPKKTLFLVIIVFIVGFSAYLIYQYHSLLGHPEIEVNFPIDNMQINEEEIIVKGKINPDNSITVNGDLVQINQRGEFNYRLRLIPGENKIIIEVSNRWGRKTKIIRTVYFYKESDTESNN